MNKKKKSSYQVPNLERALVILEYLRNFPDGLGLSELARALEFPTNSVFRIMNTLDNYEYVWRDEKNKRYRLSRKLFSLAYGSVGEASLTENTLEFMRDLRDEFKETVVLSVMTEEGGLILEQVPGLHPFRFVCDPGTKQDFHASASTKSMLAFLPKKELTAYLKNRDYCRLTENSITSKEDFLKELKEVRKKGYALDNAEALEGVRCVGAPVFNGSGHPIASITITGPSSRLNNCDLEEIASSVVRAAGNASRRFGYGLVD